MPNTPDFPSPSEPPAPNSSPPNSADSSDKNRIIAPGASPIESSHYRLWKDGFARQAIRLLLGFGLVLALLLSVVIYSMRNFGRLVEADRQNVHTYEVLLKSGQVMRATVDVENGVRSFLLSADARHLQTYTKGKESFTRAASELKDMTYDNAQQQQRLARIRQRMSQWLAFSNPILRARRNIKTTDEAVAFTVRSSVARARGMVEVRNLIQLFDDHERNLLAQRAEEQTAFQLRTGQTLLAGGVLSVVLVCGLGFVILSNSFQLFAVNRRLQHNSEQIEASNHELAHLNRELNRSNRDTQRANLELQRSNAELEQFAYVASHDLQEPLRAVSGCVQILQRRYDEQLDERAHTLIGHAVEGSQRMQTLINDLLAFSRVGTKGGEFVRTDFNEILARVKSSLSVAIAESAAHITHDDLPIVEVDAGQIEQVLQNFFTNAIKFRGDDAPRIHLSAQRDDDKSAWIFSVRDEGTGIEPQYFERIWVMFQRLHTRAEYPGTGIGLAICKKIIERHGGQVGVESVPGEGSTFWFSIPDTKPDSERATELA